MMGIDEAMAKPSHDRTYRDRVLLTLYRNGWVPAIELCRVGGLGYRSRITELRKQGYRIECRRLPTDPRRPASRRHEFRLEDA
jgi:hypothetical protein